MSYRMNYAPYFLLYVMLQKQHDPYTMNHVKIQIKQTELLPIKRHIPDKVRFQILFQENVKFSNISE